MTPGSSLGRFRLERELGSGGHGVVWRAVDTLLGEHVAIKVLKPERLSSTEARERVKREVVLARRVAHPGICRVNDLHEIDGRLVISMQLVDGIDLDVIMEEGRLPLGRALRIIDGMADAVAAAHLANVIHRDLKPSNIAIVGDSHVVVMDFGIASASDLSGLTAPGVVIGTLRYVPPETLQTGSATAQADQYALGIIGWGLLAGRLPWPRVDSAMQLIAAIERGPPDLRTAVDPPIPVAIVAVIERAMAIRPRDRFASVRDFQLALHAASARDAGTAALRLGQERTGATAVGTEVIRARDHTDSASTASRPSAMVGTQIVRRGAWPTTSSPASVASASFAPKAALAGAVALVAVTAVGVALGMRSSPSATSPAPSSNVRIESGVMPLPPLTASDLARVDDAGVAMASSAPTASEQLAAVTSRARSLGLRRGDVPAWDGAVAEASAAIERHNEVAARAAVDRGGELLAAVVVDQRFVNAKLTRFNARSDVVLRKRPELRERVKQAALDVARSMGKGDKAAATNRALNIAFGILEKP
jgi:serine/threonine-protein kinase